MEIEFTDKELAALRKEAAPQATDEQFELWIADCKRRGLVPVKDVVMQIRAVSEYDSEVKAKVFKKRAIYITTIAALRKLAERTGCYGGQKPTRWVYLDDDGNPTIESDVPLPEKGSTSTPREPWIAKAFIIRKDFSEPVVGLARFNAYAQTYKDRNDKERLNSTWSTRGPEQLGKCAVADGLRAAFPDETAGLYIAEEWDKREDEPQKPEAPPAPVVEPPKPVEAPAVNQAPATPTDAPRPGEEKKEKKPKAKKAEKPAEATAPVEPPAPAESPDSPAPTVEKPTGNIHGVDITDDDLPENLRPESGQPVEADREPNAEDKKVISTRLRALPSAMKSAIKDYILSATGVKETRGLTLGQWNKVLDTLEKANAAGALNDLLGAAA